MNRVCLIIPILLLQACATPKPMMPDGHYRQFALWAVAGERCVISGNASPEDVAYGNQRLKYWINSYSYDAQRLQSEFNSANQITDQPTPEQCNQLSLRIAEMRQQEALQAANARLQQQSMNDMAETLQRSAPKTTYCNQIGSQTICNTY